MVGSLLGHPVLIVICFFASFFPFFSIFYQPRGVSLDAPSLVGIYPGRGGGIIKAQSESVGGLGGVSD